MSEKPQKKAQAEKSLDKMTVKELREIAAGIPHERAISDMKKGELVAFIKEARGVQDEGEAKKMRPAAVSKMTKPELKARIRELRSRQGEALEAKERKKAAEFRRQISQLKKKSRRMVAA